MLRIGLTSDTHGLLRPEALAALAGCDRIVHGGDIGDREIIAGLERIAPVNAVRGNNDHIGIGANHRIAGALTMAMRAGRQTTDGVASAMRAVVRRIDPAPAAARALP